MRRDVFQAIADPVRREIIDLLSREALTVKEVAEKFAISRPAISKHLKILEECGMLNVRQEGRERYCQINPKSLLPAFLWIKQYHQLWEDRIDSFEQYVNTLQTTQNKMSELENRTLTIEKTLHASLDLVWQAWTQAEHIVQWWAPPGMNPEVLEHDFRVGGKWSYSMKMPNGERYVFEGTYREIVEKEKIVTSADFKPMTVNVEMHMHFWAEGDKTYFTFKVVHETAEYCKQQEEMGFYNGWGSAFERLEALLNTWTT